MKTIYFIRHGEAEHNVSGVFGGHIDTKLTEHGIKQANLAGQQAKKENLSFDIIVSSPLDRAHNTAKIVAAHLNHPVNEIILSDDLKERFYGVLEGSDFTQYKQAYRANEASIDHHEGVERFIDMQMRAQRVYDWLQSLPGEKILVVSHAGFGRALRRAVQGRPITEKYDPINNAELIRFI